MLGGPKPLPWVRALAQPATYFAVAMMGFIVVAVVYLMHEDRRSAYKAAVEDGENLARVFSEHVGRTINSADATLRVLRALHRQRASAFDLTSWTNDPEIRNELVMQVTILDTKGRVAKSSTGTSVIGTDLSDRDHFRVHLTSIGDELFISKPLKMRNTGHWAVILSRRLSAQDGSFAGTIAAAIDPLQFETLYNSLDLGRGGMISLVGFDGIIRARGGGSSGSHPETFGRSIAGAPVFRLYAQSSTGTYWNKPGLVDNVDRLISYRVVDSLPLIAIVGRARSEIYRAADDKAQFYYAIAAVLCAAILIGIGYGARRQRMLLQTAATLEITNLWFDTALEHMPHGLCMYDGAKQLIVSNRRYGDMYGLTPEQTRRGTPLRSILEARVAAGHAPENTESYITRRLEEVSRTEPHYVINQLRDGRMIAVSHQPMEGGGWVAVHQDITEQMRVEAEIAHMAHHDALTGLANRLLLVEKIKEAALRLARRGEMFNLLVLDLDRFKAVNDSFGHPTGDIMIKAVAERLRACVGPGDTVARLGGDEFAIVQAGSGHARPHAEELTARILESLAEPHDLDGHQMIVSVSIGIASAPAHGTEADQLLRRADLALYRAKASGRNCCHVFEPEQEVEARFRHHLESELRGAVARGELELYYQPIISMGTRQVCGVEALVRWNHPKHGLLLPGQFVPLAEETGLIAGLGEWILGQACRDASRWPAHVKVAVNLSSVQFRTGDLTAMVAEALSASGLAADRLELEITESVLLQKNEASLAVLHKLRRLGVAVVLDDFGTGYSSLSYLQMFPFDKIKIDKSFVDELPHRTDCGAIICAITGLARSLDIDTTAEGVETAEQLELLRTAGCTQAQGYLFGRPRPVAQLDLAEAMPVRDADAPRRAAGAA